MPKQIGGCSPMNPEVPCVMRMIREGGGKSPVSSGRFGKGHGGTPCPAGDRKKGGDSRGQQSRALFCPRPADDMQSHGVSAVFHV